MQDHHRRGFIRFFEKKFGYEKTEEVTSKDPRALELLINHLVYKKKTNQAYSVFVRNKEAIKNKHICHMFSEKNVKQEQYKLLSNSLVEKDAFLPQEVINDPSLSSKFLKLSDFQIEEKDVLFIDSKNFQDHENIFLKDPVLGLDCEFWDSDCTNFSKSKVATLQVASKDQCAIFDVIDLEQTPSFVFWLQTMLESDSIVKVGHSFSGDIRMLNQTFKIEIKSHKLVEVQKLIKSKMTRGLKYMVNQYMQKDFCKFNQMSGWFQRPLRRAQIHYCLLYTSPSPRDLSTSRMPSSA